MSEPYGWADAERDVASLQESFAQHQMHARVEATARAVEQSARDARRQNLASNINHAVRDFWSVARQYRLVIQPTPYLLPVGEVWEGTRPNGHVVVTFDAEYHFWATSDGLWGFDEKGGSDYAYPDYYTRFGYKAEGTEFVWNALADDEGTVAFVKQCLAAWLQAKGLPLPR